MESEEYKIDRKEFANQFEENLKSKEYLEIRIVVAKDEQNGFASIEGDDVNDYVIAQGIVALENCRQILVKNNPLAYILSKNMKSKEEQI